MPRVAAVTAVLQWVNGHPTLTGRGRPLDRGAFRELPRSPAPGCYLVLYRLDGADALTAEEPADEARIGGLVCGPDDEATERAATAYANAVAALTGTPTAMGDVATCLVTDDIVGPQLVDNRAGTRGEHAYQVDATFFLVPLIPGV
ncbi:hypothetical protein [Nonomuraea helvata]|uniref:DUF3168 domain-containing protein n=1 Tax=Nonomuraea helvata TaxID=37484 RepID=A0ABV5SI68_9ACTN